MHILYLELVCVVQCAEKWLLLFISCQDKQQIIRGAGFTALEGKITMKASKLCVNVNGKNTLCGMMRYFVAHCLNPTIIFTCFISGKLFIFNKCEKKRFLEYYTFKQFVEALVIV